MLKSAEHEHVCAVLCELYVCARLGEGECARVRACERVCRTRTRRFKVSSDYRTLELGVLPDGEWEEEKMR